MGTKPRHAESPLIPVFPPIRTISTNASVRPLSWLKMVVIPWQHYMSLHLKPYFFQCSAVSWSRERQCTGMPLAVFRIWMDEVAWLDSLNSLMLPERNLWYFPRVTTIQIFSELCKNIDWQTPCISHSSQPTGAISSQKANMEGPNSDQMWKESLCYPEELCVQYFPSPSLTSA